MATILKPSYGAAVTLTTTNMADKASDTNLLAGAYSSVVDNTSVLAVDCLVGGTFLTTATTTADRVIEVWATGSWDNATTYLGGTAPTDSDVTIATNGLKRAMKLLAVIDNTATGATTYSFMASLAQAFGGTMPTHWGLFMVQNTGQALAGATIKYTPVQYTSV